MKIKLSILLLSVVFGLVYAVTDEIEDRTGHYSRHHGGIHSLYPGLFNGHHGLMSSLYGLGGYGMMGLHGLGMHGYGHHGYGHHGYGMHGYGHHHPIGHYGMPPTLIPIHHDYKKSYHHMPHYSHYGMYGR